MRVLHMSCGEMLQQLSHSSMRPLANSASTCVLYYSMINDTLFQQEGATKEEVHQWWVPQLARRRVIWQANARDR
jgi:hypothetical protein